MVVVEGRDSLASDNGARPEVSSFSAPLAQLLRIYVFAVLFHPLTPYRRLLGYMWFGLGLTTSGCVHGRLGHI